jgi:hypothetical protein
MISQFDEVDLLDDLLDHWSSDQHQNERRTLLEQLNMVARGKGARISILSGAWARSCAWWGVGDGAGGVGMAGCCAWWRGGLDGGGDMVGLSLCAGGASDAVHMGCRPC